MQAGRLVLRLLLATVALGALRASDVSGAGRFYAQTDCTPSVNAIPLYRDATVIPPSPDVPPELARYSGWWQGTWSSAPVIHILIVESITPPYATVVYGDAHTTQLFNNAVVRAVANISDAGLTFTVGATSLSYALQPDGTLAGTYLAPNVTDSSTLVQMAPSDPCPQHQMVDAGFSLVSAGLLPASAPDALPGIATYLLRLTGLVADQLTVDQLTAGLHLPDQARGWRRGPGGVLLVDFDPQDPAGDYTLSFTLPDGRQASVEFGAKVIPAPLELRFIARLTGPKPTDPISYAYRVNGTDIVALAQELGNPAFNALVTAPSGSTVQVNPTWGFNPALVIVLPATQPSGQFTITFTLPNGRAVNAPLQHTTPVAATLSFTCQGPVTINGVPSTQVPFLCHLAGPSLPQLTQDVLRTGLQVTGPEGTAVTFCRGTQGTDSAAIIVGIPTSSPAGRYTVTLTLPDGRSVQGSFQYAPT